MTTTMLPPARPRATRSLCESHAVATWIRTGNAGALHDPCVLAVRGYYRDSMGRQGANDRGIYDDAMFIISPTAFVAFNANLDPSIYRPGIATVAEGVHWFRPGLHGISRGPGYPAFRPATAGERLPVYRDGQSVPTYGVATNIHRGGRNSTSSEGCLTLPPDQWDAFHALLTAELKRAGAKRFPLILIAGPIV